MTHSETVTHTLTGNGLVMERTTRPGGKVPWWWIKDERQVSKAQSQTYRHRDALKAYGCRWSRKRRAWYYIGEVLPHAIMALVGAQDPGEQPGTQDYRQAQQAMALRRFAEAYRMGMARITARHALPAVATIHLDDPWA